MKIMPCLLASSILLATCEICDAAGEITGNVRQEIIIDTPVGGDSENPIYGRSRTGDEKTTGAVRINSINTDGDIKGKVVQIYTTNDSVIHETEVNSIDNKGTLRTPIIQKNSTSKITIINNKD